MGWRVGGWTVGWWVNRRMDGQFGDMVNKCGVVGDIVTSESLMSQTIHADHHQTMATTNTTHANWLIKLPYILLQYAPSRTSRLNGSNHKISCKCIARCITYIYVRIINCKCSPLTLFV